MLPPGALRVIDANANRAREGVRTIEDVARFMLGDVGLAVRAKAVRHGLQAGLRQAGLDAATLARHRDTAGDVGTAATVGAAAAPRHPDVAAMVIAAGHRAAEALRVLAETARLADQTAAASPEFERLRYAMYDLQRDVLEALRAQAGAADGDGSGGVVLRAAGTDSNHAPRRGRCPQYRLCVLITEALCRRPWQDVARAAIEGGADCLQLREKSLPDGELHGRATWLVQLCHDAGVACFINDRVDIALLAHADGVHLGQDDLPPAKARELAGGRLWIGVSTHNEAEAAAALAAGADICGVGAMFATMTKEREPSGLPYLQRFVLMAGGVPHLAIGGITPARLAELAAAGCRGIAVSSAVCGVTDPAAACRTLNITVGSG